MQLIYLKTKWRILLGLGPLCLTYFKNLFANSSQEARHSKTCSKSEWEANTAVHFSLHLCAESPRGNNDPSSAAFLQIYSTERLWFLLPQATSSHPPRFNVSLIEELYFIPLLNNWIFNNFEAQHIWSKRLISSPQKETQIMKPDQVFTYLWSEWTDLNGSSFLNKC